MRVAALSALAAAALFMSAESGNQLITLCVSFDGHLDLKHATHTCHDGPGSGCRGAAAPVESPRTDIRGHDPCCIDIPLMVDLVGRPAPRSPDHGDHDRGPLCADHARPPAGADVAPPSPGGSCALPAPDREPPALAALASVVLLL